MDEFLAKHSKNPKFVNSTFDAGNQCFTYGKFKGSTYKEIFENHKDYVAWLVQCKGEQLTFVKRAYAYFINRIEEESLTKQL